MSQGDIFNAKILGPREYSLDDLIALNDELIALVRSGVPIERGLLTVSGDLPGRLRALTQSLAERMERGESLSRAVSSGDVALPPVYGALVRAGMRSGYLAVALEQLAVTARRIADLRRVVGQSLMYPLLVLTVASVVFAVLAPHWARGLAMAHRVQHVQLSPPTLSLLSWIEAFSGLAVWLPVLMIALMLLWWYATGRAATAQPALTARYFRWVPWLGRMLRYSASATFCDVLALLVEQQVPLHEALSLAGATSGDPQLQSAAQEFADRLESGQSMPQDERVRRIPPLLRWTLAMHGRGQVNPQPIRAAADDYRHRTLVQVEWLQIYVPVLLVLCLGGVVVLGFTLSVFLPWLSLMHGIGGAT